MYIAQSHLKAFIPIHIHKMLSILHVQLLHRVHFKQPNVSIIIMPNLFLYRRLLKYNFINTYRFVNEFECQVQMYYEVNKIPTLP